MIYQTEFPEKDEIRNEFIEHHGYLFIANLLLNESHFPPEGLSTSEKNTVVFFFVRLI